MLTELAIRQATERVVAAANSPVKVILFGSYGRGDANEGSDLDLIVVEREIVDPVGEYLKVHAAASGVGVGVDILLMTESEFEKKRNWWTTPVYWATREGKVLYERT
jgi:uncharacterized protein